MKYVFVITYILYIFFKTLFITNSRRNTEIDVVYLFFYLVELIFKTEIYLIFSLLNIAFIFYYNKGEFKKFSLVLFETMIVYIFLVSFDLPIIVLIILGLFDRFIITTFRKLNKNIETIKLKRKIANLDLILIKTNNKEELKSFFEFRHDVLFIENEQNIYKEFKKKYDKFIKIIVSNNDNLKIKNIINFSIGQINDIIITENSGDYNIKSIKYSNGKGVITYIKDAKKNLLTTNLISYDENKMALTLYALGKYLNFNDSDIKNKIENLKPQKIKIIKNKNNVLITNTKCYTESNHYEGLNLISSYKGNKIIVTGGIKNADESINFKFGNMLSKKFSYIILLNTKKMPLIYEKLIENCYDINKIYIIEKFEEYKKIVSILEEKKTYILLDNDI